MSTDSMETKVCGKCGIVKKLGEFKKLRNQCKLCINAYERIRIQEIIKKNPIVRVNMNTKNRRNRKTRCLNLEYRKKENEKQRIYLRNHPRSLTQLLKFKEYQKLHRQEHKDEINRNVRDRYNRNKVDVNRRRRELYLRNREFLLARKKERRLMDTDFKVNINTWYRERYKTHYKNDTEYKLRTVLRARLRGALKNNRKISSAINELGCTLEELKIYIESKFKEGMNWNNWSFTGWHLDHIKPLSMFNLEDMDEFKVACNYSNLQPLWARDNLSKNNRFIG